MAFVQSITLAVEEGPDTGSSFPCHEDAPECSSVVVEGTARCPVCRDLLGLVDRRGVVVGLSRRERLPEALRALGKDGHEDLQVEEPPATFRVRSNATPTEDGYDTITGRAECARCRSKVGVLTVKVVTLFGLEEDRRVLHGRPRVY